MLVWVNFILMTILFAKFMYKTISQISDYLCIYAFKVGTRLPK